MGSMKALVMSQEHVRYCVLGAVNVVSGPHGNFFGYLNIWPSCFFKLQQWSLSLHGTQICVQAWVTGIHDWGLVVRCGQFATFVLGLSLLRVAQFAMSHGLPSLTGVTWLFYLWLSFWGASHCELVHFYTWGGHLCSILWWAQWAVMVIC